MKQCWRWFGPDDPISLSDLHQIGVQGIVSALHHIPAGQPWDVTAISKRQRLLKLGGYDWDVVESLPISEAIKTQRPEAFNHIAAYKESLRALANCGINVVCYNFMPILDWTRTNLRAPQPHGGTAMLFDLVDFAVFDLAVNGGTGRGAKMLQKVVGVKQDGGIGPQTLGSVLLNDFLRFHL